MNIDSERVFAEKLRTNRFASLVHDRYPLALDVVEAALDYRDSGMDSSQEALVAALWKWERG